MHGMTSPAKAKLHGKSPTKIGIQSIKVVPGSICSPQNSIYRWKNNEQPLSQGIQIVVRLISGVVPKSKESQWTVFGWIPLACAKLPSNKGTAPKYPKQSHQQSKAITNGSPPQTSH